MDRHDGPVASTCEACGAENAGDARFCSTCGAPQAVADRARETRKTVTVLFSDLVDFTTLGESVDPESLRDVMTRYFDAMNRVVEHHGGTVEKFIGDAIMAVFGIPQVHDDDALRAVRAAVAMRARLGPVNEELARDRGVRLSVRIGVNTGEVVAGDPATGQRLVTGDAVNVAARLEQAAAPGEILLGGATHALVRDAVRVESLEPLTLKGKNDPVPAFRLVEVLADVPAFHRRVDAAFVARKRELDALQTELDRCVAECRCRLVTVLGPPGIGKSRLVTELVARRTDVRVVVGRCPPYGDGITYWPLVEIVKQLAGEDARSVARLVGDDGDLIADRVAAAVGQGEAVGSPEETFWAVRKLLEAFARERPLVVVLDDLEWAQPTFLDLVDYVVAFAANAPLLLVAVARLDLLERRPSWTAPRSAATVIALEPLSVDESESLVEALLAGTNLSSELRGRIVDRADGNPLFVEQMLAVHTEHGDAAAVPPTVDALLAARIDRLGPGERAVIECASVEGRLFHRGAVAALAPAGLRGAIGAHLLQLGRQQFIRPDRAVFPGDDAFRFGHSLICDAAYRAIPKGLRSQLHEQFVTWLEQRGVGQRREYEEVLGYHLEQAYRARVTLGPVDGHTMELGRRAGELLGAAGLRAAAGMNMTAAVTLLDRALAVLPPGHSSRIRLGCALGDALVETGVLDRGIRTLEATAAAEGGDGTVQWRARVHLAWARLLTLELPGDEAALIATDAVAALTPLDDDAGLAAAWRLAAQARNWAGDVSGLHAASQRWLEHARRAGDIRLETEGIFWLGLTMFFGREPVETALTACSQLVDAARTPLQRAHAQFWLAAVRGLCGDLAEARAGMADAQRIYQELGLEIMRGGTAIACGMLELYFDDPVAAENVLRDGAALLEVAGEQGYRATVHALLAEALYAQGRYDEAEQTASEGIETSELVIALKGRMAARRGAVDDAEKCARDALARLLPDDLLSGLVLLAVAEIHQMVGRTVEAGDSARQALQLYERKGVVPALGRCQRFLAVLQSR